MFVGRVVGSVWSTIKWPRVAGVKLLAVQPYHLADVAPSVSGTCSDLVVCADVLDAGIGDEVVVAYGHAARVAMHEVMAEGDATQVPIDAAIVAIVDGMDVDESAIDG